MTTNKPWIEDFVLKYKTFLEGSANNSNNKLISIKVPNVFYLEEIV